MAKWNKPKKGSRAFWPKKRAKSIYPNVAKKGAPESGEVSPMFFAGYKAGMTEVSYLDNRKESTTHGMEVRKAVTVIDCPSLVVSGVKTYKKGPPMQSAGLVWGEKISKDLSRHTRVPKKPGKGGLEKIEKELDRLEDIRLLVHTKPRESGIGKKKPELFELALSGNVRQKFEYARQKLGGEIRAEDVFKNGDWVDVISVTKGKGYQGPVKRFGVKIRSRKNKLKRRHVGTLGPYTPARVLPAAIAMPGQLGFQTRTEFNKRVLKIGARDVTPAGGFLNYGVVPGEYMLLQGSVPGPKKRLIMMRKGIRAPDRKEPVEVKAVSLASQQ